MEHAQHSKTHKMADVMQNIRCKQNIRKASYIPQSQKYQKKGDHCMANMTHTDLFLSTQQRYLSHKCRLVLAQCGLVGLYLQFTALTMTYYVYCSTKPNCSTVVTHKITDRSRKTSGLAKFTPPVFKITTADAANRKPTHHNQTCQLKLRDHYVWNKAKFATV